jgi:RNA polymerase sigma factor (sigma-70 family)
MSWIPTLNDHASFAGDDREVVEELCKRALVLIRSGTTVDSLELALLLNAIKVLALSLVERILAGRARNCMVEAADVADTFVDLLLRTGFASFDIDRPFLPYAKRTIERLCSAARRRSWVRRCVPLPKEIAGRNESVWPSLQRRELRSRVRRALRRLPKHLRRAIIARYWLGLSPRVAAARLQTNESTFNGWTFRARLILREMLKDEDFGFAA